MQCNVFQWKVQTSGVWLTGLGCNSSGNSGWSEDVWQAKQLPLVAVHVSMSARTKAKQADWAPSDRISEVSREFRAGPFHFSSLASGWAAIKMIRPLPIIIIRSARIAWQEKRRIQLYMLRVCKIPSLTFIYISIKE